MYEKVLAAWYEDRNMGAFNQLKSKLEAQEQAAQSKMIAEQQKKNSAAKAAAEAKRAEEQKKLARISQQVNGLMLEDLHALREALPSLLPAHAKDVLPEAWLSWDAAKRAKADATWMAKCRKRLLEDSNGGNLSLKDLKEKAQQELAAA
jgi:hypothetical protein